MVADVPPWRRTAQPPGTPFQPAQPLKDPAQSGKPESPRTCYDWATDGKCTKEDCGGAHFFFPRLVHRAHQAGSKLKLCKFREGEGDGHCYWAEDTCGFAHDNNPKEKLEMVTKRVEEQGWKAEVCLKCKAKDCGFQVHVDDGYSNRNIEAMVKHCKEKHGT